MVDIFFHFRDIINHVWELLAKASHIDSLDTKLKHGVRSDILFLVLLGFQNPYLKFKCLLVGLRGSSSYCGISILNR